MKKNIAFLLILIVLAGFAILFLSTNKQTEIKSDKMKVATTIFPLADIASNIGGDQVEVVNIVKPGASPHTFELNPSDVKRLYGTKMLFAIGGELDTWTTDVLAVDDSVILVKVDRGIEKKPFKFEHSHGQEDLDEHDIEENNVEKSHHDDGEYDPHYWLSVKNAKIIAKNITDSFVEMDPQNADYYQSNLDNYQIQLDNAEESIFKELEGLSNNKMIVFHESWNYFASEYGLDIVGVFALSPGKEPTPQQLADLYDNAKKYNVKAVFSEPQLSPETIKPFVLDLQLDLYILDPLGGVDERDSFINLLEYNAKIIKKALQ